jgi:hypothetical protein
MFAAGVFALAGALFDVASGDDGDVSEEANGHLAHFVAVHGIAERFQVRQRLGLIGESRNPMDRDAAA